MTGFSVSESCRCGGRIEAGGPRVELLAELVGSFRVEHALCRATSAEIAAVGEAADREAAGGVPRVLATSPAAARSSGPGPNGTLTGTVPPATMAPDRTPCDLCGGEGVVGGLLIGDEPAPVDERCGRCRGTGTIPKEAA